MQVLHALICMVLLLGNTFAACPHKQADLKKWSDAATWGTAGKVRSGFVYIFGLHYYSNFNKYWLYPGGRSIKTSFFDNFPVITNFSTSEH
jgi:hypothetical protein